MAVKFLNVGDDYAGYRDVVTGEYTDSPVATAWNQAQMIEACANGGEFVGYVDDPRLVADYVGCLSEQYLDRRNDVYLNDVLTSKSGVVAEDPQYATLYGYTLVPAASRTVRCWYCNEDFSYREFANSSRNAGEEAFVTEMLVHYSSHRAAGDLPFVTTYFPGREIRRPNGTVVATKPGVVRTWRINGKLVG